MEYSYIDIINKPDLDQIHIAVTASSMTDKTLEYCIWHKNQEKLFVVFTNTLSAGDKSLLDGIINDNL